MQGLSGVLGHLTHCHWQKHVTAEHVYFTGCKCSTRTSSQFLVVLIPWFFFPGISYIARGEPYQHVPPSGTAPVFRLVCIPPRTVSTLRIPQLAGHTFHVTSALLTGELELTSDFKIPKGSLKERREGNTQSSGNHFFFWCVCVSQTKNTLLWFYNWDKEICFPILFMPGLVIFYIQ